MASKNRFVFLGVNAKDSIVTNTRELFWANPKAYFEATVPNFSTFDRTKVVV